MPLHSNSNADIEDRLAIQDLHARYASTSSRCDREGWLDCWAEEGQWHSHIFKCDGKQAIADQYDQIMAAFETLFFISQAGVVTVNGDTATGQSQAMEIGRLKDGGFFKLAGIYQDTFERHGGRWLFRRREYQPLVQDF
jgi:ketosteroid isomerase-like protein